jgi:hypothetical protein
MTNTIPIGALNCIIEFVHFAIVDFEEDDGDEVKQSLRQVDDWLKTNNDVPFEAIIATTDFAIEHEFGDPGILMEEGQQRFYSQLLAVLRWLRANGRNEITNAWPALEQDLRAVAEEVAVPNENSNR